METKKRASDALTVALTTSATTTPEINKSNYSRGVVFVPTGETMVTLTFHAAPSLGGTYLPLHTIAGVASTQTVAGGKAYQLPAEVCAAPYLRVVANAAGSVILQFSN